MINVDTNESNEERIENLAKEFFLPTDKSFSTAFVQNLWNKEKLKIQIEINLNEEDTQPVSISEEDQKRIDELLVLDMSIQKYNRNPSTKKTLDQIKKDIDDLAVTSDTSNISTNDLVSIQQQCNECINRLRKCPINHKAITNLQKRVKSIRSLCVDTLEEKKIKQKQAVIKTWIKVGVAVTIAGVAVWSVSK